MSEAFEERRQGTDRRTPDSPSPAAEQRSGSDRRQFPVLADDGDAGEVEVQIRRAIDQYKRDRNLKRISLPGLLEVLHGLGYRRAGPGD